MNAFTAAPVQQIKYDCLVYLKEFSPETGWVVNITDNPEATIRAAGLDPPAPWLWRAALTERAARTVADFLCSRFTQIQFGESAPGPYLVLYPRRQPHAA